MSNSQKKSMKDVSRSPVYIHDTIDPIRELSDCMNIAGKKIVSIIKEVVKKETKKAIDDIGEIIADKIILSIKDETYTINTVKESTVKNERTFSSFPSSLCIGGKIKQSSTTGRSAASGISEASERSRASSGSTAPTSTISSKTAKSPTSRLSTSATICRQKLDDKKTLFMRAVKKVAMKVSKKQMIHSSNVVAKATTRKENMK